jgi:hypothetical protein
MTTLHIEHAITDFATWKNAFDRAEPYRVEGGVLSHEIRQPADDPAYVVIDLEFADAEAARRFLDFLENRIWASSESSPALAGKPSTSILERVA